MREFQEKSTVVAFQRLSEDVFRLILSSPKIAAAALPGQFVMVRAGSTTDPLLRRPFSIHQVTQEGQVHLLYKVVGTGTNLLSGLHVGDEVDLIGPLGRSFPLTETEKVCLVGGGMGIAPLAFLAKQIHAGEHDMGNIVLLGARDRHELQPLCDDFAPYDFKVETATDDGSLGHHGFVTDLLQPVLSQMKRVYVCGPFQMMGVVAQMCHQAKVQCFASMETHMACGLGACLGCTVEGADGEYRHVCKHGPVMDAEQILWTV